MLRGCRCSAPIKIVGLCYATTLLSANGFIRHPKSRLVCRCVRKRHICITDPPNLMGLCSAQDAHNGNRPDIACSAYAGIRDPAQASSAALAVLITAPRPCLRNWVVEAAAWTATVLLPAQSTPSALGPFSLCRSCSQTAQPCCVHVTDAARTAVQTEKVMRQLAHRRVTVRFSRLFSRATHIASRLVGRGRGHSPRTSAAARKHYIGEAAGLWAPMVPSGQRPRKRRRCALKAETSFALTLHSALIPALVTPREYGQLMGAGLIRRSPGPQHGLCMTCPRRS